MPDAMTKYSRRLPVKQTKHMKATMPTLSMTLKMAVASCGGIGLEYALKICTIKGLIAFTPENCDNNDNESIMTNGLSVRFRLSSEKRSAKVGDECEHCKFC